MTNKVGLNVSNVVLVAIAAFFDYLWRFWAENSLDIKSPALTTVA
ncbi:MAG: hypothetical protein V1897_12595 [Pseudomonadota bacterium]